MILVEFKFGGLITTVHKHLCIASILKLVGSEKDSQPPNLVPHHTFWLYGIQLLFFFWYIYKTIGNAYMEVHVDVCKCVGVY